MKKKPAKTVQETKAVNGELAGTNNSDVREWHWVMKGRQSGLLLPYLGQHLAVVGQQVIASDHDYSRLCRTLTVQHHLHPMQVVIALID